MNLRARLFQPERDAGVWDELCARAPMATLLHTRRFLSYHGARFSDRSLLLADTASGLHGVFPAAVDPSDASCVVSHPGVTYGGLVHDGLLRGEAVLEALAVVTRHYAETGFRLLRYKAVPVIYHAGSHQDDLYALFRLGARVYRRDLTAVIDLRFPGIPSARRRRAARRAERAGLDFVRGEKALEAFWPVLETTLAERYRVHPVHTFEEIQILARRFPDNIEVLVAFDKGTAIAGTMLFHSRSATHAQYIAASDAGRDRHALDAVFARAIAEARARGACYFDFGISNEDEGRVLNEGLYRFKYEFGAGSAVHEFYELDLTKRESYELT